MKWIIPVFMTVLSFGLYANGNIKRNDARALVATAEQPQTDAREIQMLRLEQTAAQLAVARWHRALRPYALSNDPPAAMLDSLGAARVRLDLADRAVNRFMNPCQR